ncbi:MAG TPA: hypothetical protein VG328_06785 [Stellaceae bacterium]|nr:hypothetical protein [Stellaceae bacterium]
MAQSVADQEAAAERYRESLVERGRAVLAAEMRDVQTVRVASAELVQDEQRVRQVRSEARRARQAYTVR